MLVSVIVPTYNRAELIFHTIDSINRQTYASIEIVVVDDGSTDNTAEVIESLSRTSTKHIVYYQKLNGGCASARNKGLELANGELIAFLDSDDTWEANAVESMVAALVESDADFVYSPAIEVFENGSEVVNYPVAADRPQALAIEHFKSTNIRNGAALFRKSVFETVGGLNESLKHNEDSDFVQRAAIHCRATYSPVPTVRIPHHPGQKSRNRVEIYRALIQSAERILEENSEFAATLGDTADQRLVELKTFLVESLILAGNYTEAGLHASAVQSNLGYPARLSLYLRSSLPLKIRTLICKIKERIAR
jgi:glycosyltransferase involved in cell wall biosynthesis